MKIHRYSAEERAFVAENVKGTSYADLTVMFNRRFGCNLKTTQILSFCMRRGLYNGRDARIRPGSDIGKESRFKPGFVPHNKGKKGTGGWEPTQFRKGHRPANYKPVGSERVNRDGYVEIKLTDPNRWRHKHVVVWERANGPLPKGCAVIFADGNRRNFALENLLKISRKELAYLNRNRLLLGDAELTETALQVARVAQKAAALARKGKGKA